MATLTTTFQKISEVSIYTGSYLQVWAKYTSQSVANNQSTVVAELRIHNNSGTGFNCYTHSCNFTGGVLDASDYKGSYLHGWSDGDHVLLSQTKNVTHNQDGNLSFNIGGYFTCSVGIGGTAPQTNVSLPKINRLSIFSLSQSNFNIGDTIQATITQYVSSYHQDLYMVIGSTEHLIQSSATGSIDIDTSLLANQIYQQIPNAKSYTSEFRLKTYNGTTLVGTNTKSYTANVVNSNPTFNVAYQDTNNTTKAITQNNQQIIQNNSTLQFNITSAAAQHYSTLSTYKITINEEVKSGSISSATLNVNWGIVNLTSNTNAIVEITDSRGFTTTKSVALTILEWSLPYAVITCNRQQNYYTETDINVDASYSSLDSKNTITIQYRIKKTSVQTWGNWNNLTDNTTTTFNADNQYSWDIQVKVQDAIGTTTYNMVLPVGMAILFIDRLKQSIGVNCFPSRNRSIEVDGVDRTNVYSTTDEIPVGIWIDGSIIYRKTYNVGAVSSSQQIPLGINNFAKLINVYGTGGNEGVYSPLPYVNTSANSQWGILVSSSMILLSKGSSATNFDECYITIEYTKSS